MGVKRRVRRRGGAEERGRDGNVERERGKGERGGEGIEREEEEEGRDRGEDVSDFIPYSLILLP